MPKFFKTTVRVVILHEGPFEFDDLGDIHSAITFGACSGNIVEESVDELTLEELALECENQHTSPEFFLAEEN